MKAFWLEAPRRTGVDCRNDSDPPTSTLFNEILGIMFAIPHTSIRFGSVCSVSAESTACFNALAVSSSAGVPVTVIASSTAPTSRRRSTRAVTSALTTTFS